MSRGVRACVRSSVRPSVCLSVRLCVQNVCACVCACMYVWVWMYVCVYVCEREIVKNRRMIVEWPSKLDDVALKAMCGMLSDEALDLGLCPP